MLLPETVRDCALDAAEGKIGRPDVFSALVNFDETYDTVVSCAKNPDYRPCDDNTHKIIDGVNHKPREIEKPMFCPEQILHHMIIEPFKPVLLNGLYEQVYGCLPPSTLMDKNGNPILRKNGTPIVRKYGPHAAIKQLIKWVQTGEKIFVAETDIHHAYASVHIPTLASKMQRAIKDDDWLRITFQFLHYKPDDPACRDLCGLILGHYTSPWFFNFYLKEFDHFAASQDGVKYLRFADNIYLVGKNKRKVHKALDAIREYLRRELYMELNRCTQVYRFEYPCKKYGKIIETTGRDGKKKPKTKGRAVNALGAIIHYNRVALRKSTLMRARRKSIRIRKKEPKKVTWHDGASMLSRLSGVRHTNTYTYYSKHIKPNINTRRLKSKIRAHIKTVQPAAIERREIINDSMEKSKRLAGSKTRRA